MEKSAEELRNEYKALQDKINENEIRIWERLLSLATRYPNAVIGTFNDEPLPAKFINIFTPIFRLYNVEQQLSLIEKIEVSLKERNPSKQLKLFN